MVNNTYFRITEFLWILIVGLSNYKIIEIGYQPNFILTWLFSFFVIFSFTFFLLFQYRVHIQKLEVENETLRNQRS